MIHIQNLRKRYEKVEALKGINLQIEEGVFFGLLGPNGAGKTSLMNILSGVLNADEGMVDFSNHSNQKQLSKIIGVVPQEVALYDEISAIDNLKFWGSLYGLKGHKMNEALEKNLKLIGLYDRRKDRVKSYSGGMKRRLNIAAALLHDPEIILMDEPTVGIDPQSRNLIYELLKLLSSQKKTIIYTSHYMDEVEELCSRIAIIDHGNIIANGSMNELREQTNLKQLIRLKLDNDEAEHTDQIKAFIIHYPTTQITENEILIPTDDPKQDLVKSIQICSESGLNIKSVEVEHASLQNIFLKLTGRELRD